MKKRSYIQPATLVFPVAAVNIICESVKLTRGKGKGNLTPESREHIDCEEDNQTWDW